MRSATAFAAFLAGLMLLPAPAMARNRAVLAPAGTRVLVVPDGQRVVVVQNRFATASDWQGYDGFGRSTGAKSSGTDYLPGRPAISGSSGNYYNPRYYSDPRYFGG